MFLQDFPLPEGGSNDYTVDNSPIQFGKSDFDEGPQPQRSGNWNLDVDQSSSRSATSSTLTATEGAYVSNLDIHSAASSASRSHIASELNQKAASSSRTSSKTPVRPSVGPISETNYVPPWKLDFGGTDTGAGMVTASSSRTSSKTPVRPSVGPISETNRVSPWKLDFGGTDTGAGMVTASSSRTSSKTPVRPSVGPIIETNDISLWKLDFGGRDTGAGVVDALGLDDSDTCSLEIHADRGNQSNSSKNYGSENVQVEKPSNTNSSATESESSPSSSRERGVVDGDDVVMLTAPGGDPGFGHKIKRMYQKRSSEISSSFPLCCIHCPIFMAVCFFVLSSILLTVFWQGFNLSSDFSKLLTTDGPATLRQKALDNAWSKTGVYSEPQLYADVLPEKVPEWEFTINFVYEDLTGQGMLWLDNLRKAKYIESRLRSTDWWRSLCGYTGEYSSSCDPGYSLPNTVWLQWPSTAESNEDQKIPERVVCSMTGYGLYSIPVGLAETILESDATNRIVFPSGHKQGDNPKYIRSSFVFHFVGQDLSDRKKTMEMELRQNFHDELSEIRDELESENKDQRTLALFWYGTGMHKHAVEAAVKNDVFKVIFSASFIVIYLTIHTRSLFVSILSVIMTFCGIPFAIVLTFLISDSNVLGGANLLAIFLIIGLGADVILVMCSFWESSLYEFDIDDSPNRILYVYKNGGVACFATTMTSACSFFTNMVSALTALREFGLFMGSCIVFTYIVLMFGLPPILLINERIGRMCCKRCAPKRVRAQSLRESVRCTATDVGNNGCSLLGLLDKIVTGVLNPHRNIFCALFLVTPIALGAWAATQASAASGNPQIFIKSLNAYHQDHTKKQFSGSAWSSPNDRTATICGFADEMPSSHRDKQFCSVYWCYVQEGTLDLSSGAIKQIGSFDDQTGRGKCRCHLHQKAPCQGSNRKTSVTARFVGARFKNKYFEGQEWGEHVAQLVEQANALEVLNINYPEVLFSSLGNVVQSVWSTGDSFVKEATLGGTFVAEFNETGDAPTFCDLQETCYCGAPVCQFSNAPFDAAEIPDHEWVDLETYADTDPGGRLLEATIGEPDRDHNIHEADPGQQNAFGQDVWFPGLAAKMAPSRRLGDSSSLQVVYGIFAQMNTPLLGEPKGVWEYDNIGFLPQAPSVQRHLYSLCQTAAAKKQLLVIEANCVVFKFRDWLTEQGEVYPVRGVFFDEVLVRFLQQTSQYNSHVWFTKENVARGIRLEFDVEISKWNSPTDPTIQAMTKWDEFMEDENMNAPAGADEGWHSAFAWGRAEAEQAIIESTVLSLILSVGCGFFGALAITHFDLLISLLSVLAVIAITVLLIFVITVVLGWALGPMEILGLIIFVGYSITYVIHVTHKYRESLIFDCMADLTHQERRVFGVRFSLSSMAAAILGSAFTTLGSSFFLFFCEIFIFVKIAAILFSVTFLACLYSVLGIPSMILCIGPTKSITPLYFFMWVARICHSWLERLEEALCESHAAGVRRSV